MDSEPARQAGSRTMRNWQMAREMPLARSRPDSYGSGDGHENAWQKPGRLRHARSACGACAVHCLPNGGGSMHDAGMCQTSDVWSRGSQLIASGPENAVSTKTVLLIAVIGFVAGEAEYYVDIALMYALIGFIATVAVLKVSEFGNLGQSTGKETASTPPGNKDD